MDERPGDSWARPRELSATDQRILDYIREGLKDAEIAVRVGISTGDVKARIERLAARLGWMGGRGSGTAPVIAVGRKGANSQAHRDWSVAAAHGRRDVAGVSIAGWIFVDELTSSASCPVHRGLMPSDELRGLRGPRTRFARRCRPRFAVAVHVTPAATEGRDYAGTGSPSPSRWRWRGG